MWLRERVFVVVLTIYVVNLTISEKVYTKASHALQD